MYLLPLGNIQIIIHIHLKDTLIIINQTARNRIFVNIHVLLSINIFFLSLHLVLRHILIGNEYQILIVESVLFSGF